MKKQKSMSSFLCCFASVERKKKHIYKNVVLRAVWSFSNICSNALYIYMQLN